MSERDEALAAKSMAFELKDVAMSKRDQAVAEKNQALELKDIVMSEREGAVSQLEKLQAKAHKLRQGLARHKTRALKLSSQLSLVLWLLDLAFFMGLN